MAFPLGTLQVPDNVDLTGFVKPQALLPELLSLYWPVRDEIEVVDFVSYGRAYKIFVFYIWNCCVERSAMLYALILT